MFAQLLTLFIPVALLLLVFFPRELANNRIFRIRSAVSNALALQLLIAAICLVPLLFDTFQVGVTAEVVRADQAAATALGGFIDNLDHYDGVSALMYLLVSFVGLTVCRFSIRYLDGEQNQGTYFRWLGFTLGAVSLLVVAGNLVLFFAAWVMTSFGLHQLLLFYGDRAWARRAAWTKFAISRAGDVFLLAALVLVYREFGTYHLAEILSAAAAVTDPTWQLSLVGWLLILGAVTKSAQFPVHFWLPETMEAPTPVSALMHAGIVNAGGYLLVRLSPVVAHAPLALATLAIIGGFTAVFASVVMMTQPSVKRSLGYSTIAQMGFMMLQCGLGAFAAAMLHIVAHSLYKAHAFLRSGDAWKIERIPVRHSNENNAASSSGAAAVRPWIELLVAAAFTGLVFAGTSKWFAFDVTGKAGGLALSAIVCLAIASWLTIAFRSGWRTRVVSGATAVLLVGVYMLSYSAVNAIVKSQVPPVDLSAVVFVVSVLVVVSFGGLAALQVLLPASVRSRWLQMLYVHASNGFYVDTIVRKSLGLSLSRTPSAA